MTPEPDTNVDVQGVCRIQRKIKRNLVKGDFCFDEQQRVVEASVRSQAIRRVRMHLRRMEPVVVLAPRWSRVREFLEMLSAEMSEGSLPIRCQSSSFRSVSGRSAAETWEPIVQMFYALIDSPLQTDRPSTIADRRGFRWSITNVLEQIHRNSTGRVALLGCDAEYLPLQVIEDLMSAWRVYGDRHPIQRRCTLLFSGSTVAERLRIPGAPCVELVDYGAPETLAALISQTSGWRLESLEKIANLTGGVPGVVMCLREQLLAGSSIPPNAEALIPRLGHLGLEIRGALDIAFSDDALSQRLEMLLDSRWQPHDKNIDGVLVRAGLIRKKALPDGGFRVSLRTPLLAAMLG